MRGLFLWVGCVLALSAPAVAQPAGHAKSLAAVAAPPGFRDACRRYAWLCRAEASSARPLSDARLLALADRVNAQVNGAIVQVDDRVNYDVAEYWSLPDNGRGDCEDLALLKTKMLLEAGVDPKRVMMAIVLDRRGNNHAVLLLRLDAGDVMLDSLSDRVAPWHRSGYTFLAKQTSGNKAQWGALLSVAGQ